MIPAQAVITAKTSREAERLLNFLRADGYHWASGSDSTWWHEDREDTCYDLEDNHVLMHCSREWYEEQVRSYDAGGCPDDISWLPPDRSWLFISTDDFIARCEGEDDIDSNVDISALM